MTREEFISKFSVGDKITVGWLTDTKFLKITSMDVDVCYCQDDTGYNRWIDYRYDWQHYEETKKPKKLYAPAIVYDRGCEEKQLSIGIYSNEDDAKAGANTHNEILISWPALPNKDGYYEIEEE